MGNKYLEKIAMSDYAYSYAPAPKKNTTQRDLTAGAVVGASALGAKAYADRATQRARKADIVRKLDSRVTTNMATAKRSASMAAGLNNPKGSEAIGPNKKRLLNKAQQKTRQSALDVARMERLSKGNIVNRYVGKAAAKGAALGLLATSAALGIGKAFSHKQEY